MKPLARVSTKWSPELAYAVGLLAADGSLSANGRHISFTSKDLSQAQNLRSCLGISNTIGRKGRGGDNTKRYHVLQFGDVRFYAFLQDIGMTPNKSKTLSKIQVPPLYFADFLRGVIDGDGCISTHKHPESKYLQLRTRIISASPDFLLWLKSVISEEIAVSGGFIEKGPRAHVLCYGKQDSLKVLNYIYYDGVHYYLERKYRVVEPFLRMWRNRKTRAV